MMRKTLRVIAGLGLLTLGLVVGEALAQQHLIVRVSPEGSLIIVDQSTKSPRDGINPNRGVRWAGSHLKANVIRGSAPIPDSLPIISRGRRNPPHSRGIPWGPVSEALHPNPSPATAIPDTPIAALIEKTAQEHGLDPSLVRLVVQKESGFNPQAVSPKGAMGLMQLMPGTAALLGVQDPFNPAQNIDGGVRYLKQCLERFQNNICLALAAYNAGPENVAKYQGVPPFAETRNYVANIMEAYTGQFPEFPQAPAPLLSSPGSGNAPLAPRKAAWSQADLQPLFLPGGGRVNIIRSGRAKIFEIHSP